jgi:hypothetical protein
MNKIETAATTGDQDGFDGGIAKTLGKVGGGSCDQQRNCRRWGMRPEGIVGKEAFAVAFEQV